MHLIPFNREEPPKTKQRKVSKSLSVGELHGVVPTPSKSSRSTRRAVQIERIEIPPKIAWHGLKTWGDVVAADLQEKCSIDGRVGLSDPSLTFLQSGDFAVFGLRTEDIHQIVLSLTHNKHIRKWQAPYRSKYYAEQMLEDLSVVLRSNTTLTNLQIFYHGGSSPSAITTLARILEWNTTLKIVAFSVDLSKGANESVSSLARALERNEKTSLTELSIEIVSTSSKDDLMKRETNMETGIVDIAKMLRINKSISSLTVTGMVHQYTNFATTMSELLSSSPTPSLTELTLQLPMGREGCLAVVKSMVTNDRLQSIKFSSGDSMMFNDDDVDEMLGALRENCSLVQIGVFLSFQNPAAVTVVKKIQTRNYRKLIGRILMQHVDNLPDDVSSLIADFTPITPLIF